MAAPVSVEEKEFELSVEMPSDVILRVQDLKVWFPLRRSLTEVLKRKPPRYVRAVDGISFDLRRGETFCLVGESGCGKTTTGKAILRLVDIHSGTMYYRAKPDTLEELARSVSTAIKGDVVEVTAVPDKKLKPLRREMQMIYQDPFGSLNPRFKIKTILEEPLLIHKIGATRDEREELIIKALESVRLVPPEDFMNRYPHQLSGGQRQRVAIARALILNPQLIIADEPVSMLDVSIRAEILDLMIELQKRQNLTYIFITHDLAVARYICDRIAVMYLGKIVELAKGTEVIEKPYHPYTKALIAAIPEPDPSNRLKMRVVPIKGEVPSAVNIPPGCRFHPRCVAYDEQREKLESLCPVHEPPLVEVEKNHYAACWLYETRKP